MFQVVFNCGLDKVHIQVTQSSVMHKPQAISLQTLHENDTNVGELLRFSYFIMFLYQQVNKPSKNLQLMLLANYSIQECETENKHGIQKN